MSPSKSRSSHLTAKLPIDNSQNTMRPKKSSSAGLFRLFSKGSSNDLKQDLLSTAELSNSPSVSAGLQEMGFEVVPCNFIRPRGLKLEPRNDTPAVRAQASSSRLHSSESISPSSRTSTANKYSTSRESRSIDEGGGSLRRPLLPLVANGLLTLDANMANKAFLPGSPLLSPVSPIQDTGLPAFASLHSQFVAGRIARDFESSAYWKAWLTSYSNGEFSVQNPPAHPPLSPSFSHLPAVYPQNEEKRSFLSRQHDLIWDQEIQERVGIHMSRAMESLGTQYAAMSFFDQEYEVFKAENGYNVSRIQRSISIAAHALYTTEVLCIKDTTKNNPMVTGKPRIKFFAGAPMVNANGDILGVLLIFSREPREVFSHDQRRLLADFSAGLMSEMDDHMTRNNVCSIAHGIQPTAMPNSQSECPLSISTNQRSQRESFNSRDSIRPEACPTKLSTGLNFLMPPPLRFHKMIPHSNSSGRVFSGGSSRSRFTALMEHTPPSSVESGLGSVLEDTQTSSVSSPAYVGVESRTGIRGRPFHGLLASPEIRNASAASHYRHDDRILTQDGRDPCFEDMSYSPEGYRHPSPQRDDPGMADNSVETAPNNFIRPVDETAIPSSPFSTPDLASLYPLPPNTPNKLLIDQDPSHHPNLHITVEDFLSLSDRELSESSGLRVRGKSLYMDGVGHRSGQVETVPRIRDPDVCDRGASRLKTIPTTPYRRQCEDDGLNRDTSFEYGDPEPRSSPNTFRLWKFPQLPAKSQGSSSPVILRKDHSRSPINDPSLNSMALSNQSVGSEAGPFETKSLRPHSNRGVQIRHRTGSSLVRDPHVRLEADASVRSSSSTHSQSPHGSCCFSPSPSSSLRASRRPSAARSTLSTASQRSPLELVNQAAFALASHCKSMGYGLMYIAKVYPRMKDDPIITESEILASRPRGIKVQLLTAHGLSDAIELCPLIHLNVLRSRGPTSWEDFSAMNDFQRGVLMVINSESGPLRYRSRGLILGAFWKAQPNGLPTPNDTAAEMKALAELCQTLKNILQPPRQTSQTFKSPDGSQAWSANDAIE